MSRHPQRNSWSGATAGRPGAITVKDIARRLDVSSSTVARALNDSPLISGPTKSRVKEAARDLGYVVHSAARVMRGESSTLVGLTVPDIVNEFYATLASAVAEVCRDGGFQMVLSITADDPVAEHDHLLALVGARAAGAVIVPTANPLRESLTLLDRIPSAQLVRRHAAIKSDWFSIDDVVGIREAAEHLIGLGHRRIAYVGASADLSTGAERLRGFQSALQMAGLPYVSELAALTPPHATHARSAFRALYDAHEPTAVLCGGDQITNGVLQAVGELGLEAPHDLSIVAYNDTALYRSWPTPLTAIALPVREIALAGGAGLTNRIRHWSRSGGDATIETSGAAYRPRLIIRQSTAPPPLRRRARA